MDEDRDAVIEALMSLNATAKRCPHVTHFLMADPWTAWDHAHKDVDDQLYRVVDREPARG